MDFKATKTEINKLPKSKQEIATALYNKCVFQNEEIERLQVILRENGWTEPYQNGANQSGRKKTGEADSYISLMKIFNQTVKQLNEILNSVVSTEASDGFLEFVGGKKTVVR